MSNIAILAATIHEELNALSNQAGRLAEGLQNVAPAAGASNNSIEYLLAISDAMKKSAEMCEEKFKNASSREAKP